MVPESDNGSRREKDVPRRQSRKVSTPRLGDGRFAKEEEMRHHLFTRTTNDESREQSGWTETTGDFRRLSVV